MNPVVRANRVLASQWSRIGTRFLPFADAATLELPLPRLLRLSLFQVSVGMATVLLVGTLNRVMIVELGVAAWLVSVMVALPLVFAPFRALIGFRSDTHRSVLGWKRVPYIWFGTLLQFGGLAIMPFALLVLSGDTHGPLWIGHAGAGLAFLLVGAGLQTTQTAGLALATDLAPEAARPRVVALMYVMLLIGMVVSGLLFGVLLRDFTQVHLIQVVQGVALATMLLNLTALWKQEARNPAVTSRSTPRPAFRETWNCFARQSGSIRFLAAVGLGTAAFNMQDIILEPYGGEILHLGVAATTTLTALMAGGALTAFALAARWLGRGADPHRLAAYGVLAGVVAFAAVIFAEPLESPLLFRAGATLIGFGSGLFSVGTLTAAMGLETGGLHGLALGAWGAVQASCAGVAIALGGTLRDAVSSLAMQGHLGAGLVSQATGYSFVYHVELGLLFATLVAIGPLVRRAVDGDQRTPGRFGLAEFPRLAQQQAIQQEINAMGTGAITGYVDVAQIALYAFWIFFAGLIYYLHRENKREGYPLESDRSGGRVKVQGFPAVPRPKTYLLRSGKTISVPRAEPVGRTLKAAPTSRHLGAPLEPTGDPMLAAVGPGSYADRADVPDLTLEDTIRIVPLRVATDFVVASSDPDPRGLPVVGADGKIGGVVRDLWVDRSEAVFRYLEVELPASGSAQARRVLLPFNFTKMSGGKVKVRSILARHFADVPLTAKPDQVTFLEEDKIMAYYGGGTLYATPQRQEPLL